MKILITGATGKVGSRLTAHLLQAGEEIRVLVRDENRAENLKKLGAEILVGDLSNLTDIEKAVKNIDVVIHTAAAFRGVSDDVQQAVNFDATVTLAKAAIAANVKRFIFASTTNVYLENTRNRPATENDQPTGTAMYPASKIAAENALSDLTKNTEMELIITRFGLVYGDKDPHLTELAPYFANRHPEKLNSLLHHKDLDLIIEKILHTENLPHQLYNLVDDQFTTVSELLQLENIAQKDFDENFNKYESASSNERLKVDLNYEFQFPNIKIAQEKGAL